MFEIVLLLIFPWPRFEKLILLPQIGKLSVSEVGQTIEYVPYFITDLFLIVMFLRIGFLIRTLENYDSITDAHSKKLCRSY